MGLDAGDTRDSGAIDQDVDPAMGGNDGVCRSGQRYAVGNVYRVRRESPTSSISTPARSRRLANEES